MAVSVKNKISAAADEISKKANKFVNSASNTAKRYIKQNPTEARTTILGTGVGAGLGFAIGGSIGVVGFFGGVGIPWFVLLALSGGFLGNRFGLSRDKKILDQKKRNQDKRLDQLIKDFEKASTVSKNKTASKPIDVLSSNEQHREILKHALHTSEKVVVVLCGWATSYVIDSEFQRLLAKALRRGVSVYLGYGYQSSSEPTPLKKHEREAENNLLALKEWAAEEDTKGLLVVKKYPNHAKILICDDKYAINGSFNWLSNAGRSRNIERSWIIRDRQFVVSELEIILCDLGAYVDKRDFLKVFVPWSRH